MQKNEDAQTHLLADVKKVKLTRHVYLSPDENASEPADKSAMMAGKQKGVLLKLNLTYATVVQMRKTLELMAADVRHMQSDESAWCEKFDVFRSFVDEPGGGHVETVRPYYINSQTAGVSSCLLLHARSLMPTAKLVSPCPMFDR